MDPVLRNLIADGRDDELEVVLKLAPGQRDLPETVRVVARFGEIVTARVPHSRVAGIRELDFVTSVKGGRPITLDEPVGDLRRTGMDLHSRAARRTRRYKGRGVVVGAVDFGLDLAHPQFRNADGSTRIRALWNQAGEGRDNHYGYGRIWRRDEINAALTEDDPYDALDYNASRTDRGEGAHGTHVCSVAAGKGGIAPEAELIFVDLTTRHTRGRRDLGDSLCVLEGLDFIFREADDSPCVVNCSIGGMGGAKDGLSLVEQAMDALLTEQDGRAICQSTGNYFRSRTHASGQLEDDARRTFGWEVNEADRSGNELEIWYPGNDEFELALTPPHGGEMVRAPLGSSRDIVGLQGRFGRIHHRALDSTNGDNHVDIFLDTHAPTGRYEVEITGLAVSSGRYDAWIERDGSGANQSRFSHEDVDPSLTIGTICTGQMPLVVGAYDGFTENRAPAAFSSRGPTRDGREKPDLSAPGIGIEGARSARITDAPGTGGVSYQSGTSMATPHVTGAVALLFEAAGRPLSMAEIREAILSTVDPADDPEETRLGRGHLAIDAAIRRVEAEDSNEEITMDTDESDAESFPTLGRSQHCNCGEAADSDEYVKGALDDNWQDDEVWHDQNWEDDAEEGLGLPDDDEEAWQTEVFEEPHTSPRGANAPFAPEFGPGSYWPLISSSPRGRLVSYRTAGGSMVGFSGRIFGASRSRGARFHVGIDLFGNFGDPVIAIEDGEIIRIYPFCCGRRKTSSALFVAHQNVVVNYGEVDPNSLRDLSLSPGDRVRAGQQIGTVGRNPGGSTMIHFETYLPGTRGNQRWMVGRRRPSRLLNPTRALLNLAETGLDAGSTTRPTPSVTPAVSPPVSPAPSPPQDVGAHSCRSGEGPPAAQPDPSGRGPHPLVRRGTSRTRSRNPQCRVRAAAAQSVSNAALVRYRILLTRCEYRGSSAPPRCHRCAPNDRRLPIWATNGSGNTAFPTMRISGPAFRMGRRDWPEDLGCASRCDHPIFANVPCGNCSPNNPFGTSAHVGAIRGRRGEALWSAMAIYPTSRPAI